MNGAVLAAYLITAVKRDDLSIRHGQAARIEFTSKKIIINKTMDRHLISHLCRNPVGADINADLAGFIGEDEFILIRDTRDFADDGDHGPALHLGNRRYIVHLPGNGGERE